MKLTGLQNLLQTVKALRHPQTGCPWDLKQTHESLASYCVEEACEVVDAIESGDRPHLVEELGDLLLQITLHAQLLEEKKLGDFDQIAQTIHHKMVERHPHVFQTKDSKLSAEDVLQTWNERKLKENSESENPITHRLEKLPKHLPALHRAVRHGSVLQGVRYDWESAEAVLPKIEEEMQELKNAIESQDATNQEEELGDLLYVLCQWARLKNYDPEQALRKSCRKGIDRIRVMEDLSRKKFHKPFAELPMDDKESLWEQAKVILGKKKINS